VGLGENWKAAKKKTEKRTRRNKEKSNVKETKLRSSGKKDQNTPFEGAKMREKAGSK